MKDIFLKSDGNINEEGIDEYIKNYGIEEPYENRDSIYNGKPPLYIAISSNEIDAHIKVKLVSCLISKGAKIGTGSGLINIALYNQNFDLADLLLRKGASVLRADQNGNLIDIALHLKNEQVLRWVMENAKSFFWTRNLPVLYEYHQKLTSTFPNSKDELSKFLKESAHQKYSQYKFSHLGLINSEDIALILAAKMAKKSHTGKSRKNSIFVITDNDITTLVKEIKSLIENDTPKNIIKFQIIHFDRNHGIFGEFVIDKTSIPPTVKYAHCDPAPPKTKYNDIITSDFRKQISPLANIEIYDSYVFMQKGTGCSYFSIDGAMMLATPPDRDYVVNVIEYMKKHGKNDDNESFEEKNVKYIRSSSLPTRFIRGLQYIVDEGQNKGLNTLVFFNPEEKNTVVNVKGETAEVSIRKDLQERPAIRNPSERVTLNIKAESKMKGYGETVNNFIKNKNIIDPEFYRLLDQYNINGFVQFCEEQIEIKKEKTEVQPRFW